MEILIGVRSGASAAVGSKRSTGGLYLDLLEKTGISCQVDGLIL